MDLKDYLKPRKQPTSSELRLYLIEVNNRCPLCGKTLQSRKQKKRDEKKFEIAHIFPNSPTSEQLKELDNVPLLGENSESFENKIALCLECHHTQDFHTKREEYLKLYQIKTDILASTTTKESLSRLNIENDISKIIQKLTSISPQELLELRMTTVPIANKFTNEESLLKNKVQDNVNRYFNFLKENFIQVEGLNGFNFNDFSQEIKSAFLKVEKRLQSKNQIFMHLVNWLDIRTQHQSMLACEIIISYFIQTCEVFHEITK